MMQVLKLGDADFKGARSARVSKSKPSRVESSALRAVRSIKRKFGENHVEHGHSLLALGDTLLLENRVEQSATAYRGAAVVYAELGVGHELLYASALRSLAQALAVVGETTEARDLLRLASDLIRAYQ